MLMMNSTELSPDTGVKRDPEPSKTSADSLDVQVDRLAAIRSEAAARTARELQDVRTALTACYDQAISRLGDNQWIPLEPVTQLVNELTAEAAAQRARAADLAGALDSAKGEVESVREECQSAIIAAREAAILERKEAASRFARGLNAARDAEHSASMAAAKAREELSAVRNRYQEILDSQMLQLVTFKRELEQTPPKADRAKTAAPKAEAAPDTAPQQPNRGPADVLRPSVAVTPRAERSNREAPGFDAIEAALAESPPIGKWPSRAAV